MISGKPTDIAISVYADRVLIVVTQNGKPGTLLHVTREIGAVGGGKGVNTRVLMGKRDDSVLVYAKKIGEMLFARTNKPLLLGLCVLDDSPDAFRKIVQVISQRFSRSRHSSSCALAPLRQSVGRSLFKYSSFQALSENIIW